jgi:hypothetical protein
MCTEDQHHEKMRVLASIEKKLDTLTKGRPPIVRTIAFSATNAYMLDYMDRKHVYMFSTVPLILDLKALGTYPIPQNTWTPIDFQPGMSLFALGQTSNVNVMVRGSDEVVP